MTHTQQSLEALDDRRLDGIVAVVVFQHLDVGMKRDSYSQEYVLHYGVDRYRRKTVPAYSDTFNGLALVLARMNAMGWTYDVDATAPELGIDVCFHPKNPAFRATGVGPTLPRAAAIAAVLALQGPV